MPPRPTNVRPAQQAGQQAREFDESKHPRAASGRFGSGGSPAERKQRGAANRALQQADSAKRLGMRAHPLSRVISLVGRGKFRDPTKAPKYDAATPVEHKAWLKKLPVAPGTSLHEAETLVQRVHGESDQQLTRDQHNAQKAADILARRGFTAAALTLGAHAKLLGHLIDNRQRIVGMKTMDAAAHVQRKKTTVIVKDWNELSDGARLKLARKRATWKNDHWEGSWPGKAAGYVMYEDASIGKPKPVP